VREQLQTPAGALPVLSMAAGIPDSRYRPRAACGNDCGLDCWQGAIPRSRGAAASATFVATTGVRVSQIDARDIAAVAVQALTRTGHEGKAYELSGAQSLSFHEVAAILTRVLGREIRYVETSAEDYKNGAVAAGVSAGYADALVDLFDRYYHEAGEKAGTVTSTVREVTGREPIRYEQFARDYAAALR
jgi:hypothetical protein